MNYEFIYCHKGAFAVYYEDHQVFIESGEILIILPNTPHQLHPKDANEVYWVHFDFYYHDNQKDLARYIKTHRSEALSLRGYSNSLARPSIVIKPNKVLPQKYSVRDSRQTRSIFMSLIHIFDEPSYEWPIHSKYLINQLLVDTFKHLLDMNEDQSSNLILIQTIHDYLTENLHRKLSHKELSNRFHYHSDTLTRIFKKETGKSMRNYIKEVRLSKVKKLLQETNLNLDNIAGECGFTDRSHLIKVFKEAEEMTPNQFRLHGVSVILTS